MILLGCYAPKIIEQQQALDEIIKAKQRS